MSNSGSNLMLDAKLLIQRGASKEDAYLQVLKETQEKLERLEAQVERAKAVLQPAISHDDFVKIFYSK